MVLPHHSHQPLELIASILNMVFSAPYLLALQDGITHTIDLSKFRRAFLFRKVPRSAGGHVTDA